MDIHNPFTDGQIKNYLLFYVSIVVIMILFFIASTLFNKMEIFDKKTFMLTKSLNKIVQQKPKREEKQKSKFKLLDKAY